MAWQQVTLALAELDADTVESALLAAGAVAVTYTDAADQPILEPAPGEAPLWREARLTALFPEDANIERIGLTLAAQLDGHNLPAMEVSLLPDRAWEREWLRDYQPMRFADRLWVLPHGADIDTGEDVVVRLDPGLAFGTGTHATTALCLTALATQPPEGARVLDFGCGSGILAIAALKLGADTVLATDIDPQALTATRENAQANDVADRIDTVMAPMTPEPGQFDLVVANILAQPLIELAARIAMAVKPGGRLLLSGILADQAKAVAKAYDPFVEFDPTAVQDGWTLLEGTRRRD
ncbi:MAG: 50S ribosomal protein L11 methyltransferase [Pseudomonadota bacterium]